MMSGDWLPRNLAMHSSFRYFQLREQVTRWPRRVICAFQRACPSVRKYFSASFVKSHSRRLQRALKRFISWATGGGGQIELKLAAQSLDAEWATKGVLVRYVSDLYYKSREQARKSLADRHIVWGT